jgi:hypothetical protein
VALNLLDYRMADNSGHQAVDEPVVPDGPAAYFVTLPVRAMLDAVGVPYTINERMVRGLDYYTRTTFEFYVTGREGQQQAVGGGGRYDGLVELMGGRPTPGIGFGIGLDRLILALTETGALTASETGPVAVVVGADPADTVRRLAVATDLRGAGISARAELGHRKLGKQLEADKKWPDAAAAYSKAHGLDPAGASATDALAAHHFTLGKALEAQGKDGGPDFRRAVALKPDYAPARSAASEVAEAAGRPTWMLYAAAGVAAVAMMLFAAAMMRRRA